MASHLYGDTELNHVDYCVQILGIGVWERSCQLTAEGYVESGRLGATRDLPVEVLVTTRV